MERLTGKERISRLFRHEPVDRIGWYEQFWGQTGTKWIQEGYGTDFTAEFSLDMDEYWAIDLTARPQYEKEILEEKEDIIIQLDGNWATMKWHKDHSGTPEHIGFFIDDREKWESIVKPLLTDDSLLEKRIDFEGYREKKQYCKEREMFFVLSGVNVFEAMHPLVGHEEMLAAMVYDPEWIEDMANTYADLIIRAQKLLFEKEGLPDGIWYYEDMGYKQSPFMSPAMYDRFLYPLHKRTCDFAHSLGLPVIMHSCGFVEPLLDGMVRAGIDGYQAIEIKAGMDLLRIYEKYGDQILLMGGIDVRVLYSNDRALIDAELEKKIPAVMGKNCYVLHSDHSIPPTVDFDTCKYFMEKGLELGTYHND